MTKRQIQALRAPSRRIRAALVIILLLGGLFSDGVFPQLMMVAIVLVLAIVVYELSLDLPRIPSVLPVLAYFLLLGMHAIYITPTTEYGADKLSRWLSLTLVSALSVCLLRTQKDYLTLALTWTSTSTFIAVMTLLSYDGGRATTFGANPIWLGRAVATGILICVWLWWSRIGNRWLIATSFTLQLGSLIASGSRGPILAVIVGILVMALVAESGRSVRMIGIFLIGFFAVAVIRNMTFFSNNRFSGTGYDAVATDLTRSGYGEISRNMIWDFPLGVGWGNWHVGPHFPRHKWPHNIFLEIGAELGIILLLVTLLLVAYAVTRLLRRIRHSPVAILLLSLLAAELVNVSVSGDINARTFWFVIAAGVTFDISPGKSEIRSERRIIRAL